MSPSDTSEVLKSEKGIPAMLEPDTINKQFLSLERILGTNDLVGISFLQAAIEISKTVGRVWICGPGGKLLGYGTGFMVSPNLMITNHHVIPEKQIAKNAKIEFKYELDADNNLLVSQTFTLDPESFYIADEELDFALVAVAPINSNKISLGEFGWNKLSIEEGKTIISQWLNVIQHPNGMPKQIGLRENQLIDVLDNFLHYKTDTSPGSSGSPVFNERWEVVALHHAGKWQEDDAGNIMAINGKKWNRSMGEDQIKWIANEGIRISSILKFLDSKKLNAIESKLYNELRTETPRKSPINNLNPFKPMNTESSTNPDGSVTLTIPISVTLRLCSSTGNIGPVNHVLNNAPSVDSTDGSSIQTKTLGQDDVLQIAKQQFLNRPDVLNVRMGYVFKNGWITNERALVVSVVKKKSIHNLKKESISPLPDKFMEYPVEVTTPTIEELIAFHHGQERLESLIIPTTISREEIKYFPPQNSDLKEITDQMKVIAHVSPEEGWNNLQPFLRDTKRSLTVGMYDFGATHIQDEVIKAGVKTSFKKMILNLQSGESVGEGTKKNDLPDAEVVQNLKEQLANKFQNAWVKIGSVNGWISSSYHIKVAIRDSKSFWLSSGNWQSSNQPDIPGLNNPSISAMLNKYNREWHVTVEHEDLAKTFESFIKHDFENNKNNIPAGMELMLENLNFLIPEVALPIADEATAQLEFFESFEEDRQFTVMPLLTPDNYFEEVINLIKGAKTELLIQNQTFNAPKEGQDKLEEMLQAVLDRQNDGVDVKIIFRVIISSVARENLEKLIDMGFDANNIKVQKNCHTKGIIVDKKVLMLGSQNFSNDGVSVNRDASLIFKDVPIAGYFRKIFFHDWNKLARQNIGRENMAIEIASDVANIPEGMELITWSEIREIL